MGFGVGYLGQAWGVPELSACGFAGGILHILNHALFKCLLFYAAGGVYHASHSVDLERLGGLAKRLPQTAALFLVGGLAIAGLPPLNGFVSEFIILRALLSGAAPVPSHGVVLVAAAAVLAFVGGVSALAMTRAFGIAFLGNPRDPSVQVGSEPPLSMRLPMALLAAGVIALGVVPELGLWLTRSTSAMFSSPEAVDAALRPLGAMAWASRILAALLLAVGVWRWLAGRSARRTPTWGCGYTAPSPRMQYTGTSFAEPFMRVFESLVPVLRRERLPSELFPAQPGQLATHHPDAVESRIFEVLRRGEQFVSQIASRIPEQPRFAFAAALCALILIAALVTTTGAR
jgi:hydrogenase-4 component B